MNDRDHPLQISSIARESPVDRSTLAAAIDFLRAHEVENSIQLAVFLAVDLDRDDPPLMLVVLHGDQVVGVASLTPPFNLLLSHQIDDRAGPAIAGYLATNDIRIPGVMGAVDVVQPFVGTWVGLTAATATEGMRSRILACDAVTEPGDVSGRFRIATDDDWPAVEPWFVDFFVEAYDATQERARERAAYQIRRPRSPAGLGLWIDPEGEIVAVAGKDPTGSAMRIGPVFVPVHQRGRGYGKAVTAAITRVVLDAGCASACLYTDAGNPVSNHVYESIGYRHVVDSRTVVFRYGD